MIAELKSHPIGYGILVTLLVLGVISFLAAWPNREVQRIVAVGMGGMYFFWGILSHVKTDHLTRRIVIEYLAVSILASSLLLLVTW